MSESNYIRQRDITSEHGQTRDLSYPPLPEPLPVAVYDNHAHLEISDGDNPMEYREHLERAAAVGVKGAIQVGETLRLLAGLPRLLRVNRACLPPSRFIRTKHQTTKLQAPWMPQSSKLMNLPLAPA